MVDSFMLWSRDFSSLIIGEDDDILENEDPTGVRFPCSCKKEYANITSASMVYVIFMANTDTEKFYLIGETVTKRWRHFFYNLKSSFEQVFFFFSEPACAHLPSAFGKSVQETFNCFLKNKQVEFNVFSNPLKNLENKYPKTYMRSKNL
jgi:hypothetical protein